jgi:hypothetical protein
MNLGVLGGLASLGKIQMKDDNLEKPAKDSNL